MVAEMIERNLDAEVPLLELAGTTVRKLKAFMVGNSSIGTGGTNGASG